MKRYFTTRTKEKIYQRDGKCVLGCNGPLSHPHHVYFGIHYPKGWKKGDDVNGEWNGVTICQKSHDGFHHTGRFCNGKSLKENREYLEKLAQERYEKMVWDNPRRKSSIKGSGGVQKISILHPGRD